MSIRKLKKQFKILRFNTGCSYQIKNCPQCPFKQPKMNVKVK